MALYTERHGMRAPIEKTYSISLKSYSLLYDCCAKYYENLAWKYQDECPDGLGICGFSFNAFNEDMEFEIPTLFRRDGRIDKPRSIENIFSVEPDVDEYDQYALFDLIEFVAQNVRDITYRNFHRYYGHDDLSFGDTNAIAGKFLEEINSIFRKTGLLYQLTENLEIERTEEASVLSEKMLDDIDDITESGVRELLIIALQKHKSPYPNDQKDAVEKIWDAFERLKSYYATSQKEKASSIDKFLTDMSGGEEYFKHLFDTEFKALTNDIGNACHIRHSEVWQVDITDMRHYDYFFNRCLSMIALAIQYLKP